MEAEKIKLKDFLKDELHLVIPIYQRMYNWEEWLCEELWKDIKKLSANHPYDKTPHFMGSIVRIGANNDKKEMPPQVVIDGQQRITTIILLLSALVYKIREEGDSHTAQQWKEDYLVNIEQKGNLYYKILLGEEDKESLKNIIDEKTERGIESNRIRGNFDFFRKKLENEDPKEILAGIRNLVIVDIFVDSESEEEESPHQIFESLNSKGLPLTQSDLIRNYVLMGQESQIQKSLYIEHWREMEQDFGQEKFSKHFGSFIRHYLTMKMGKIPKVNGIYESFKEYIEQNKAEKNIKELIAEIHKYSRFYTNMALGKEPEEILKREFEALNSLTVDPAYPFFLALYSDYVNNKINKIELKNILLIIQSYVFRRFICNIPANTFNNTFTTFHKNVIDKEGKEYISAIEIAFAKMEKYKKFPSNDEFYESLTKRDLYNIKHKKFLLEKYEKFESKESLDIDKKITVEHIMPQNRKLRSEWIKMLSREDKDNWRDVQEEYLHTLGNLTLTGYNSELGDKPFEAKKPYFNESRYRRLNESLRNIDNWNKIAIENRTKELANGMLKVWKGVDDIREKLSKEE